MQKKKAPILVLSVVGVMVILVGLTNSGFWQTLAERKAEEQQKGQAATNAISDKDKSDMAKSLSQTAKQPKRQGDEEGGPTGVPDKPIILVEKQQYVKQQQNESAVSSGWFRDNANTSNKEAELNRKRGTN